MYTIRELTSERSFLAVYTLLTETLVLWIRLKFKLTNPFKSGLSYPLTFVPKSDANFKLYVIFLFFTKFYEFNMTVSVKSEVGALRSYNKIGSDNLAILSPILIVRDKGSI